MENRTKSNDQLFSEYFDVIKNTHSRASLYEAKRLLNHFKEFIGNFPPTTELAAQFLGQYVDRKPNTKARYHFTVSAFFRWYSGEGLSFKVKTPKLVAHIVTDEEIERVIDSIKNKRSHKNSLERDILLIRMLIHTGLRRAEMANLMVGDLNLTGDQPFLTVKGGKGAKDRIVPLNNYIKELLAKFTQGMAAEENILKLAAKTITLKISKWAYKAGVKKLTTHSLRHKFATDLLNKGANIKVVQELMGHESLETTQVYLSTTDKGLRDAVNLLVETKNMRRDRRGGDTSKLTPLLVIECVYKSEEIGRGVMTNPYYSHFEITNDGNSIAKEVEIALLDSEKKLLETQRVPLLKTKGVIKYTPLLKHRSDSRHFILCQYKGILSMGEGSWFQAWLPFELKIASRSGELYVEPREIEFKYAINKENGVFDF